MIEINQLEEVIEDGITKLIVDLTISGKINFKVYFAKNSEGNLCAYINKDINLDVKKRLYSIIDGGVDLSHYNNGFQKQETHLLR